MGQWCGYVAVPPGHPLHGLNYDADAVNVDVHGELTYAHKCQGLICHIPKPGEPDNVWWFGFDCAHLFDLTPRALAVEKRLHFDQLTQDVYRDLEYVKSEIRSLAEQLSKVTVMPPAAP